MMAFIEDDERLLIMDMNLSPDSIALTYDEMVMLKGAGVKTLYFQAGMRWDIMQPSLDAPFDWSRIDRFVNDARRAGLKMLIPVIYAFPHWFPDEFFFSREANGESYGVPDYNSAEAAGIIDDMICATINRYTADDCQVVFSIPSNGEFPFHQWPSNGSTVGYDMDTFVSWVVDRQRLFVAQHDEVWTAYHPYTNPTYWRPLYGALFSEFPIARHYGIIFTYVQHGQPHIQQLIDSNRLGGMRYFAGAEYVQGLRPNMGKLKAGNMRALIAPKHPYQKYDKIEEWMLDDIAWAIEELA